ncbi:SpoIID/LytB domain-containing protein [Nodosilinea sp. LEGE 07088]|uniref:SpoIID/LytB domain-containing protein n=1 Tax=Nodosilinea sp. LEGE 07088 TaxID=2777968 RepID=UPI001880FE5C|nr:SpoIID/LytB domain-containing protein [Nodosilinea sp. LEGE 07088]MBE9140951.1 SpoIID/LytB domain-containing protein [Nodosilinea sp. LEGE 07088]
MVTLSPPRFQFRPLGNRRSRRWLGVVGGMAIALTTWAAAPAPAAQNPVIQVGIVQRFGENLQDRMILEALSGEQLTLSFETNGQPQTVTTTRVVLGIAPEPLPEATLGERVVLSNHRSFETAEHSAQQWRDRGIEPEIAQPGSWEVWANRETYNTPLVRRLLVDNLKAQGFNEVFLDSRVLGQIPKVYFEANGYRYQRDSLDIRASDGRVRVVQTGDDAVTRVYGGTLRVQPNTYGTYTLVNSVPIETYLRGVVPHEIGPSAPVPAIQAQTVLARTYALRNLRRFAIDDYELCADTQCQVYRGLSGTVPVADQAITATQGQVLTYENELADTLYSSTTGGVTAAFSDVWDGPDRPYLRPVVDSVYGLWDISQYPLNSEESVRRFIAIDEGFNEDTWRLFRWRNAGTLAEITQDLKGYLSKRQHPMAGLTEVRSLQVTERANSGRVQTIDIETDLGVVQLKKDEIVRVLTPPRSLLFYLEPMYETPSATDGSAPAPSATPPQLVGYQFVGGGWGHGVGMSQTGSYRLGELGWAYPRILQFYYPGTTLQPISDQLTFWREPSGGGGK